MKTVDHIAQPGENKAPSALSRVLEQFSLPFAKKKPSLRETLTIGLNRSLDNKFTLLCDIPMEGLSAPLPFILVGPPGVWVIFASTARGVFRAQENVWEELDHAARRMKSAKPNLLTLTVSQAKAVEKLLSGQGASVPSVEPVLFFSDPGVHVEAMRPSCRIVLADALDRFAASLLVGQPILDAIDLQKIVDLLSGASGKPPDAEWSVGEVRDAFSFRDTTPRKRARSTTPVPRLFVGKPDFVNKIPFSRRQWILLGVMLVLNIILLIALVLIVLSPA